MVAEPAAEPEAIARLEEAQRFGPPSAYRELLLLADGIEVGHLVVMGTKDAFRLDAEGPDRLIISPPNEDGAFVLSPTGEIRFVELEAPTSEGRVRAPDLRAWVREGSVRP